MNGLADVLGKCLALATETKNPSCFFLDSLDQLSDTDNAKAFILVATRASRPCTLCCIILETCPNWKTALNATYKEIFASHAR